MTPGNFCWSCDCGGVCSNFYIDGYTGSTVATYMPNFQRGIGDSATWVTATIGGIGDRIYRINNDRFFSIGLTYGSPADLQTQLYIYDFDESDNLTTSTKRNFGRANTSVVVDSVNNCEYIFRTSVNTSTHIGRIYQTTVTHANSLSSVGISGDITANDHEWEIGDYDYSFEFFLTEDGLEGYYSQNSRLYYMTKRTGSWQLLDTGYDKKPDSWTSGVVDNNGVLKIAYMSSTTQDIEILYYNGASFVSTAITLAIAYSTTNWKKYLNTWNDGLVFSMYSSADAKLYHCFEDLTGTYGFGVVLDTLNVSEHVMGKGTCFNAIKGATAGVLTLYQKVGAGGFNTVTVDVPAGMPVLKGTTYTYV